MPNPNHTQAVNLLRRLRADSTRQEAEKAAKALIEQIRAHGASLTIQGVVRTALASHPDHDAITAVQRMAQEIAHAGASNSEVQRLFNAAAAAEEIRLGPFDAACAKRGDEIQNLLEAAHLDYRSKIMSQDFEERRYKSYTDKGLVLHEIAALGIPAPVTRSDEEKRNERNAWGFELEQTTQALTTERDAITRFKYSRNENALPASVLALVEG
jgi:hypothetical protein